MVKLILFAGNFGFEGGQLTFKFYYLFHKGITKDMYEEKLKQYDTELKRIEDKLRNVEKVDKDFYITAEYIIQLAKHSSVLFKCSEYEERRLLINVVLMNVKWKRVRWGTLVDVFRTKVLDIDRDFLINNIKLVFLNRKVSTSRNQRYLTK